MKTIDGYEAQKGHYYYLENGTCVCLEEFAQTPDGRDLFVVCPFYEGETMSVSGAGGYHHEITASYEHEGEPILVEAIFNKAPTGKLCTRYAEKLKQVEALALSVGVLQKDISAMELSKRQLDVTINHSTKQKSLLLTNIDSIKVEKENIKESIAVLRQKYSELEDSIARFPVTTDLTPVSTKELQRLNERDFKLQCLEDGGVDSWEWFDESLKDYRERYPN